jgi:hypothetical protein
MFCPHCGKSNSTEIKFCRSCGLSLDKVKESLAEQLPLAETDNNLRDKQRRVERLLTVLLGTAFTVFVLAILWALIYKIIIVKGEILEGSIFLGLFVALVAALLMVVYRESLLESIGKRRMSQLSSSENKTTEKLPEPSFEPIASVTERTTSLLFTKDKSKRKN